MVKVGDHRGDNAVLLSEPRRMLNLVMPVADQGRGGR